MNETPQNTPFPGYVAKNAGKAILIIVEFDGELLHRIWGEGGVSAWNKFIGKLFDHNMTPPGPDERCCKFMRYNPA